jgi:hypothetical protein
MLSICARTRLFERIIVPATENPDLIGHARGIGTKRHIVALGIHDPFFLAFFLFYDVAKNAAFLFPEPFAGGPQFVENPSGHKSCRTNLRVRVGALLPGERPIILVDGDIFEPEVALQIFDALSPGLHDQHDLIVGQILKLAIVFRRLDDDFIRAHRLHLVVDPVGPTIRVAFHAI